MVRPPLVDFFLSPRFSSASYLPCRALRPYVFSLIIPIPCIDHCDKFPFSSSFHLSSRCTICSGWIFSAPRLQAYDLFGFFPHTHSLGHIVAHFRFSCCCMRFIIKMQTLDLVTTIENKGWRSWETDPSTSAKITKAETEVAT